MILQISVLEPGSQLLDNAQTPFSLVLGSLPHMSTSFALVRDGRVGRPPCRGGFLSNDSDVVKWGGTGHVSPCARNSAQLLVFVITDSL